MSYVESENPHSPHYSDQLLFKSRGELKKVIFYLDEMEEKCIISRKLSIEG
ncbi:MAG: hypothetical protein NDF54_03495 [archaeon GB-1867-035]|nr:hypothetical protein [Candidatus Culexmicrobium profundum]